MILLSLIAAVAGAPPPAQNRVMPPFPARPAGMGMDDCPFPGLTRGAPVPAEVRKRAEGSLKVRIIRPGDRATMDMIPTRRNIHVDAQGRVVAITCG